MPARKIRKSLDKSLVEEKRLLSVIETSVSPAKRAVAGMKLVMLSRQMKAQRTRLAELEAR